MVNAKGKVKVKEAIVGKELVWSTATKFLDGTLDLGHG
jgi:hypothetical protein